MYKLKFHNYILPIIMIALFSGCSKPDNVINGGVKPTADFSFTNVKSVFTFTNLSKNGKTYRWDFGDLGFYSYETNPVHAYTTVGGELYVTLTVTDEFGQTAMVTKTIQAPIIKIVNVVIDGKFDEWKDVDYNTYQEPAGVSIQKIKIWAGGPNINVYLEGTTTMKMELVDMFINSDGNDKSGFISWQWPISSGADWLFEGPLVSNGWGDFYQHNDPAGGWGWNQIAGSGANLKSSGIVSINATTNAIEFSIPKAQFGTLGTYLGFSFSEMTAGWGAVASFPNPTATSSFVKIEL